MRKIILITAFLSFSGCAAIVQGVGEITVGNVENKRIQAIINKLTPEERVWDNQICKMRGKEWQTHKQALINRYKYRIEMVCDIYRDGDKANK